MGVLKTKKKLPRRVKKTIRRTVSALCMVSAIIVALVPAKPTEGYTQIPPAQITALSYAYGIQSDGTDDVALTSSIDLAKYRPTNTLQDSEIYKTYYVRTDPSGNYEYWWKFKAYAQNVGGSSYGVICDYNTLYQTNLLEINKYQPIEYLTVTQAEYDAFYQAFIDGKNADSVQGASVPNVTINGKSYKNYYTINQIGNMILEGSDEYFLNKYFSSDYADYKIAYEAWQAKMAAYQLYEAWNNGPKTDPAPNNQQTDPTGERPVLKKYVTDMLDADKNLLKRKYFCEVNQDYNTASTSIKNYTLVAAKDYTVDSSGLEKPDIYLVQGEPNIGYDGGTGSSNSSDNDALGFFIKRDIPIIAIGKQAFKGVQNVIKMKLSSDIAYIGDEAFLSSYVQDIEFSNVQEIGNRAFKKCAQLASITFGSGTSIIGTEAFEGCFLLSAIKFPYSIKRIGPGAFANCTALSEIDMSEIGQADCKIDGFAFYNDTRISNVLFSDKITEIGDAAFALDNGPEGSWTEVTLPDSLSKMGDFMLAGRSNMTTLNMPINFGRNQMPAATLPEHFIWNCTHLGKLVFPDDGMGSSGYVDFSDKSYIFASITNPDFYVQGPEKNSNGLIASPRTSTWGKTAGDKTNLANGKPVPYVYKDSAGNMQYEISNGKYILVIDNNGVLQSCQFAPGVTITDIEMTIPESVGNTKVTGISSKCFDNETLRNHMTKLTIEDNTITEIAANAFKDYKMLKSVYIGNTVTKIGASAFEGCNQLQDITFAEPVGGYSSFPIENIGEKAFSTESGKLTLHGGIDEKYGPFVWATDAKNYVDPKSGIRVCYQTGYPTYLTVIVDNRNGLATLVDYPHYEQMNILSETQDSVTTVSDSDGNIINLNTTLRDRYEMSLTSDKDLKDANGQIIYTYDYDLTEKKLIDAILNIDIPSGIESIDSKGYLTDKSKLGEDFGENESNGRNRALYCLSFDDAATYELKGLFNGYYGETVGNEKREYPPVNGERDTREKEYIGNDRVKSITMHSVEYLPDDAFYSCEQLEKVVLGNKLTEMGEAPFAGCPKLSSIGSSTDNFVCENGIVYSQNPDGTYTIVEVLSSRGLLVGDPVVKVNDADPKLSQVTKILDGAFKDCDTITEVDFTGVNGLKEIPDTCFMNCDDLRQVILPDNIAAVGHYSFAGCPNGIRVVVYGTEFYLPNDAFGTLSDNDDYKNVDTKYIISYKDSAAYKAGKDIGAIVTTTLDDKVKVNFFDYDGTQLGSTVFVEKGKSIPLEEIPKTPERAGYKFNGWNRELTNVVSDMVVIATYVADSSSGVSGNNGSGNGSGSGSGSGNGSSDSTSGNNTKFYTLTVTNGNGSGSYAEGATVIITCTNPPAGQVFDKWVPATNDLGIASVNVAATTLKMPAHEASVTATFKKASPSNTSGSGSVSGNNSNNSNRNKGGNTIIISKSGISNTDLASAQVTGSNDNYVIRISETAAATAAVEKALTNEYGSLDGIRYSAMDISLYDATGTNRITNYSGLSVTLTLPIPDVLTQYAGNNKVAGVVNEKLDKLSPKFTTIDGVPCITFTCTHFSPYTIYVDTGNLSANGVSDISPKTGDIQPKWFLVAGLAALSIALFFVKDKRTVTGRVA